VGDTGGVRLAPGHQVDTFRLQVIDFLKLRKEQYGEIVMYHYDQEVHKYILLAENDITKKVLAIAEMEEPQITARRDQIMNMCNTNTARTTQVNFSSPPNHRRIMFLFCECCIRYPGPGPLTILGLWMDVLGLPPRFWSLEGLGRSGRRVGKKRNHFHYPGTSPTMW